MKQQKPNQFSSCLTSRNCNHLLIDDNLTQTFHGNIEKASSWPLWSHSKLCSLIHAKLTVQQCLSQFVWCLTSGNCNHLLINGISQQHQKSLKPFTVNSLKALLTTPHNVPVILLTGLRDESVGRLTILAGAEDFISKADMDPKTLEKSIIQSIERKRRTA